MALLSDAADRAGIGQAMAIATANLAWALGHVLGGAGGSGLADLTADAVPYGLMSALCLLALATVARRPREQVGVPSRSAPARAGVPRAP